jgi:hypothetical protein
MRLRLRDAARQRREPVHAARRHVRPPLALAAARRGVLLLVALLAWLHAPGHASADERDRVIIRGNYYREDSNRILQPQISYVKTLPDERFWVGTDYLLDVISSASIAAAAQELGGDEVFTEMRHEATGKAGLMIGDFSMSTFLRYSSETDYQSTATGLFLSQSFLQKTVTLSASYSYAHDRVYRIQNNTGVRSPWGSLVPNEEGLLVRATDNLHQSHYASLGYTQVISRTILGMLTMEAQFNDGPQDNPYRRVRDGQEEVHPLQRRRFAPAAGFWFGIPRARMVIEPHYRFYADDWDITAHAFDTRLHVRVLEHLRLRLRYRYYKQSGAFFFRPDGAYLVTDRYRTADPKMLPFDSHTPGIELTWELDGLASRVKRLAWLRGAWIQATYNHVIPIRNSDPNRDYRFGDARLGSLAVSLAF